MAEPGMIEVSGLTKSFGKQTAVSGLSFSLARGDAFGFIGPNGAGKTTTIRMLATLLRPDAGQAAINGCDIHRDPEGVRRCVGYMPDFFGLYDGMKVWEYLDFFAAAYRVPNTRRTALTRDVLELVDLTAKRNDYVDSLSRGMKQRLCLAKALVHDPEVLLLDEPASGLDPRARVEIRELLRELTRMDKTILISSHILPELAELCNKIGIIEQGRLVMAGAVDEISAQLQGGRHITIGLPERHQEVCDWLSSQSGVISAEVREGAVEVVLQGAADDQRRLLAGLVQTGFPVESFAEQEMDLEHLYMRLTQGVVS